MITKFAQLVAKAPTLSAGGLGCLVAAAWLSVGTGLGLAVLGVALLALEWRLEK